METTGGGIGCLRPDDDDAPPPPLEAAARRSTGRRRHSTGGGGGGGGRGGAVVRGAHLCERRLQLGQPRPRAVVGGGVGVGGQL